ncbi:MAG: TIGR03936 family radical SAM-associated protein [Coriobacteriales bacterium]|jgi:radical SAM-linked protein|nr:TIGR03936 family radical SAM-associated protein [Coriobacteriales bacterium]
MSDFRLRINFQKLGKLRQLSHLELARALERCVRRSGLPYAISQGFSAHMRHSFSAALPVGTASLDEYMDLELTSFVPPKAAVSALQQVAVFGLPILGACYVSPNEPALQATRCLANYEVELCDPEHDLADQLLAALRSTLEIIVRKKGRPRSYHLPDLLEVTQTRRLVASAPDLCRLFMPITLTEGGSLRPELILEAVAPAGRSLEIVDIIRISLRAQPDLLEHKGEHR